MHKDLSKLLGMEKGHKDKITYSNLQRYMKPSTHLHSVVNLSSDLQAEYPLAVGTMQCRRNPCMSQLPMTKYLLGWES